MRFCLTDGTQLELMTPLDDMETAVFPGTAPITNAAPTAQIPPQFQTAPNTGMPPPVEKKRMSTIAKVLIGMVILGVVGIGLAAVAGGIYLASLDKNPRERKAPSGPIEPPPPPPPTRSEKKPASELEKRIAELEDELDEAKAGSIPNIPSLDALKGMEDSAVATVNSPKDGYLALRSLPGTEQGERIAKIPNGETVVIYGCTAESTVDGKPGKWCRAIYNAKFGWVFDAWLDRL